MTIFGRGGGGKSNDNNDGSALHPKATVAAAVTAALPAGKDVYVAAGIYDAKVSFLSATGNIGVYGGYAAGTWQRSAANVTTLRAPGQVVGVAAPRIVLQLVHVESLSGPTFLNSYGVRAFNGGSVALSRVTIQTAPGAKGTVEMEPASDFFVVENNLTTGGRLARRVGVASKPLGDKQKIIVKGQVSTEQGVVPAQLKVLILSTEGN